MIDVQDNIVTILGQEFEMVEFSAGVRAKYMAFNVENGVSEVSDALINVLSEIDKIRKQTGSKQLEVAARRLEKKIDEKTAAFDAQMDDLPADDWTDEITAELQAKGKEIDDLQDQLEELLDPTPKLKMLEGEYEKHKDTARNLAVKFVAEQLIGKPELAEKATSADRELAYQLVVAGNALQTPTASSLPSEQARRKEQSRRDRAKSTRSATGTN